MIIRKGSKETVMIKEIQTVLNIPVTGIFDDKMEKAVMAYQRQKGLVADGEIGRNTFESLGILDTDQSQKMLDTGKGLKIERYFLPPGEYVPGPTDKQYLFIHHTAGWHNPYKVVDSWGRDSRGRVGTEFVVGGQSILGKESTYDGKVLQCIPEGSYGWHLGATGSPYMHEHSVGIEICSFGYLKDGKTYTGNSVVPEQISTLSEAFRGFTQWHKYSDGQLDATQRLLKFIADRDNIDLQEGLVDWIRKFGPAKAFEFNQEAYTGKVKGLLTHTNVRKDKTDNFPQPELIDMLLSL